MCRYNGCQCCLADDCSHPGIDGVSSDHICEPDIERVFSKEGSEVGSHLIDEIEAGCCHGGDATGVALGI